MLPPRFRGRLSFLDPVLTLVPSEVLRQVSELSAHLERLLADGTQVLPNLHAAPTTVIKEVSFAKLDALTRLPDSEVSPVIFESSGRCSCDLCSVRPYRNISTNCASKRSRKR